MAQAGQRKCACCGEFFLADHRNRGRQRYCSAATCRLASKTASQAIWLAKPQNTDYFRSPVHVRRVQAWRLAHRAYSAAKPGKPPAPKALQDGLIAQAHDFIEETAKRTEMPEPACEGALQDLMNA